jgi:hypothetical protein
MPKGLRPLISQFVAIPVAVPGTILCFCPHCWHKPTLRKRGPGDRFPLGAFLVLECGILGCESVGLEITRHLPTSQEESGKTRPTLFETKWLPSEPTAPRRSRSTLTEGTF